MSIFVRFLQNTSLKTSGFSSSDKRMWSFPSHRKGTVSIRMRPSFYLGNRLTHTLSALNSTARKRRKRTPWTSDNVPKAKKNSRGRRLLQEHWWGVIRHPPLATYQEHHILLQFQVIPRTSNSHDNEGILFCISVKLIIVWQLFLNPD